MPLFLNERQVGFDPLKLGFPGIGACMGMAVQDAGGLFGFHVMPGDAVKVAEFISLRARQHERGNKGDFHQVAARSIVNFDLA